MKTPLVLAAALVLAGLLGWRQTARAGHCQTRQASQHDRIQNGIASGLLTPAEARNLYRDRRNLHQLKRHYLADGRLSGRERRILDQCLDRASQRIYRYKHNHRQVPAPWGSPHGFRASVRH